MTAVEQQCRKTLVTERQAIEQELAREPTDTLWASLKEIDDALYRIDHGELGVCEQCKGQIDDEVLCLTPAARYCEACADLLSPLITSDRDVG